MIVYSPVISNRLRYVCDFIGNEITGSPFQLTSKIDEFNASALPRLNYSHDRINASDVWLQPHPLLSEKNIKEQEVKCFEEFGYKAFFQTMGDLHFDLFSAVFYLLTRYEEYLPHKKDSYGRYAHENSLAYREKFLDKPLINIWLNHFRERLGKRFPSMSLRQPAFSFVPTYDIDEAFSFRHKQWWRSAGGSMRDLIRGNTSRLFMRRKVIRQKEKDPFDSYSWMDALHQKYVLYPHYFFLVAGKTGKYDKNILPDEPAMRELIGDVAGKYSIGIHPSWQSYNRSDILKHEIKTLEQLSGQKVISSRQHFIRMNLPDTYRQLIAAGILKDFSMGYGSINGFRASIASDFPWYDLSSDQATNLRIYPFCFMDANAFFEQKLTPKNALNEMRKYYKTVKLVNGSFVMIWHNTFLCTDKLFEGWREAYEAFIDEIVE